MRLADDLLDDPVASIRLGGSQAIQHRVGFRTFALVIQVAFLFVAKRFAIRDQELQVTCVGRINVWIIDFVDEL